MWALRTPLIDKFHAAITECLNKLFLNKGFYVQCNSMPQAVSSYNLAWRMSSFRWTKSMRQIVSRETLVYVLCSLELRLFLLVILLTDGWDWKLGKASPPGQHFIKRINHHANIIVTLTSWVWQWKPKLGRQPQRSPFNCHNSVTLEWQ